MRIRLNLEYDGTRFVGWQRQLNGLSVQQVVEEALSEIVSAPVGVVSSGRTDAGVHALGMTVHFDSPRELPLSAYREGVNRLLPADVVVREAAAVPDNFHARFSAVGKWYRYTLWTATVRSALHAHRCWHVRRALNLDAMQKASSLLLGEHDFAAFTVSGCDAETTVRRIDHLRLRREESFLHLDVVGNGFLRYMVRRLVGTLVEVGCGKRTPGALATLLDRPGEHLAGVTAPPQGLFLMRVHYPGEDRDFWENFP